VNLATSPNTVGLNLSEMLQSSAEALRPPIKTTVGDPLPLHFRYILAAGANLHQPCEVAVFCGMGDGHTELFNEGNNNNQQGV